MASTRVKGLWRVVMTIQFQKLKEKSTWRWPGAGGASGPRSNFTSADSAILGVCQAWIRIPSLGLWKTKCSPGVLSSPVEHRGRQIQDLGGRASGIQQRGASTVRGTPGAEPTQGISRGSWDNTGKEDCSSRGFSAGSRPASGHSHKASRDSRTCIRRRPTPV